MQYGKDQDHFVDTLAREAQAWERDGLISADQRMHILERYAWQRRIEARAGSSRLIATITILGSILIGVGVLLFIAANWAAIPKAVKLLMIFGILIGTYGTGYFLRFGKGSYPKLGAALIFLGTIMFGAAIFLIAQIYHISAHYPNGVLIWGVGILPLVYVLRFRSVLILTLAVLCLWFDMELTYHMDLGEHMSILALVMINLLAGLLLWMLGLAHAARESYKELAGPYLVFGMIITLAAGFVFTFELPRHISLAAPQLMPYFYGASVLGLASLILFTAAPEKERGWVPESTLLLIGMATVFGLVRFFPGPYQFVDDGAKLAFLVAANSIFLAVVIGIVLLGYVRKRPAYINIGLVFFVVFVCARYFDFFWKFLPRSIFFIVGGCILLAGGAAMERKRRMIMAEFARREGQP